MNPLVLGACLLLVAQDAPAPAWIRPVDPAGSVELRLEFETPAEVPSEVPPEVPPVVRALAVVAPDRTDAIGAANAVSQRYRIGPLLVAPRCGDADPACRRRVEDALALAGRSLLTRAPDPVPGAAEAADATGWFLSDAAQRPEGVPVIWPTPASSACPIALPATDAPEIAPGCVPVPPIDAPLAARLHDLGTSLLEDARALRDGTLEDGRRQRAIARVAEVAAIPPNDAVSFAGWCRAIDGAQCLLRASGDFRAADLRLRELTDLLVRIGAKEQSDAFRGRVAAATDGISAFSVDAAFPLECWVIGERVLQAHEERRRVIAKVTRLAVGIALRAGMAPGALRELELRLASCEPWLPLGIEFGADPMRALEAHLETRLVATERPEWDVTDARAAAWESYAALWNLGGAMPDSLVRLRGRQRDACAAEFGEVGEEERESLRAVEFGTGIRAAEFGEFVDDAPRLVEPRAQRRVRPSREPVVAERARLLEFAEALAQQVETDARIGGVDRRKGGVLPRGALGRRRGLDEDRREQDARGGEEGADRMHAGGFHARTRRGPSPKGRARRLPVPRLILCGAYYLGTATFTAAGRGPQTTQFSIFALGCNRS